MKSKFGEKKIPNLKTKKKKREREKLPNFKIFYQITVIKTVV